MAGVYIHIPFCKKACHYCNFHFSTSLALQHELTSALLQEIGLQKNYLSEPVSTIYFGGGTPSILPADTVSKIVTQISDVFGISTNAEVTLEANPDDITIEKLSGWKHAGVNRLSIGVQSFFQQDLDWMNRAHNANQAEACITLAQLAGFSNLSIDLIYGTPTLTDKNWKRNIDRAISMQIPHLSCYALTVEHKTALERMIQQKKLANVDGDKQARHFELLMQWLLAAGYEHYEISNFALPGCRSKHNSSYWQGKTYLGLGPSAHSFNGVSRQWNIANSALYIKSINGGQLPFEIETLTTSQRLNEYIMISLRTAEGISLDNIRQMFGESILANLMNSAVSHLSRQLLIVENDALKTTAAGKLMADGIASDLFVL